MHLPLLSRRVLPVAVVLLAAAGTGWGAPTPSAGIVEYDLQVTAGAGKTQKTSQKMWFKGQKIRSKSTREIPLQPVTLKWLELFQQKRTSALPGR